MIYVLSDIHGNSERFNSIMEQINLQPEDTLYVLGDVVDRYPDGIKILKKLIKMNNVKILLGNHEYMMLNALDPINEKDKWEQERALSLWYRNGGYVTHNYLKHIRKDMRREIFDFLRELPINIKIEVNDKKFLLVHGSPLENYNWEFREYETKEKFAVWERWQPFDPVPQGYTMIFGHTPTINFQDNDPLEICKFENAIGIDCGCGYPKSSFYGEAMGRLACVRLNDMKVFYSEEEGVENDKKNIRPTS